LTAVLPALNVVAFRAECDSEAVLFCAAAGGSAWSGDESLLRGLRVGRHRQGETRHDDGKRRLAFQHYDLDRLETVTCGS
jgi:hypothetical protein